MGKKKTKGKKKSRHHRSERPSAVDVSPSSSSTTTASEENPLDPNRDFSAAASSDQEFLQVNAASLIEQVAETIKENTIVSKLDKSAASPGLVEVLKDLLLSNPDFDYKKGIVILVKDSARSGFHERLYGYLETQPGFEAAAHLPRPKMPPTEPQEHEDRLVDESGVMEVVQEEMKFFCKSSWSHDADYEEVRDGLRERLVAKMTDYVLRHPEYNSRQGTDELKRTKRLVCLGQKVITDYLGGLMMEW